VGAHTVEASPEGFVNAIDGKKPGDRQFWSLKINGQEAEVGAKQVITKKNDVITWELVSY